MLTETGQVIAIDDDGLWVEALKRSTCSNCDAKRGCGQKLLSSIDVKKKPTYIKAFFEANNRRELSIFDWKVGDPVRIGIEKPVLIKSALIAYLVPLVVMLVFAMILSHRGASDYLVGVAACFGLILGGLIVRCYGWFLEGNCNRAIVCGPVE